MVKGEGSRMKPAEVNGLTRRSGGPSQRATHAATPVCPLTSRSSPQVRARTVDRNTSCFFDLPPLFPFCLSHSLLFTFLNLFPPFPPSITPSGTSKLPLCKLSRWPSLRSALECCFYIAASGGMWSLFWTARQTDGGFHAAFMRLSETFP